MVTVIEHLERMATKVRAITDHDIQVSAKDGIYVNYGYNDALVIETHIDIAQGLVWTLTAYSWDRTGGVADEYELGWVHEDFVAGVAKLFLDEQDRRADELDKLMGEGE
jgi:hypothetical protein